MSECVTEVVVQVSQPNFVDLSQSTQVVPVEIYQAPTSLILVEQAAIPTAVVQTYNESTVINATESPQTIVIVETSGVQGIPGPGNGSGGNSDKPINPIFTYNNITGKLERVDYDEGAYKNFIYNLSGNIHQIESFFKSITTLKTFNYVSGVLTSIDEVVV